MSVSIVAGLAAAAIAAGAVQWSALHLWRDSASRRAKMASRFEAQAGLMIFPDAANWVGTRVRRRAKTSVMVAGLPVPVLAVVSWLITSGSDESPSGLASLGPTGIRPAA